ncbi:electron transfer flavoprotein subunit alpha/FixB family protein [Cohnella thermotolerans]|uniref:electron transfer flavoprotein subunit alpha/FixB family protein n=1 Tax=Cohnella thermotolerans TaxID=329858 RepID=UPI0004035C00|nr:electron transfer flavoprotein subunit alpha/FixB family protein [Cohnella thermotolerans]
MGDTFLVVAEGRDGKLRQVSFETIRAAKQAMRDGDRIAAALIGDGVSAFAGEIGRCGVDRVYVVDHAELSRYNPEAYFPALAAIVDRASPDAIFFGHTAVGRDLAPKLAAQLGAGQISDVVSLEKDGGGEWLLTRPLYAGKAFETRRFAQRPAVVTVRPNNFAAAEVAEGAAAEVEAVPYAPPASPGLRTIVKEVVRKASGKIDLTEAKIVVSGGRGVKSAEGFQVLERLADVLGAAVGASRGACDAGYCDYALQIGQTGKVVTPEIYIACGISGAIQHLAGMSRSRIIIAINKDPEAPIFKVADYGIVGDLFEVVPLLTEEFKKALA